MDVRVRPLEPDDLPRVKEITCEAFDGVSIDQGIERLVGPLCGHPWQWHKARQIEQDVARDPQGVLVAVAEDQVVGYITTWVDVEAGIGYIPNLAVCRQRRGQGIGRMLIQHALDRFRDQQIPCARIETLEQNPIGQQLYPALGFREVARQIHYCISLDLD